MSEFGSRTFAAAVLWLSAQGAVAVPLIEVDMDPGTAGTQTSVTVDVGDVFSVAFLVSDVMGTAFDTAAMAAAFNDAGSVLALGPGGAVAGTLATAPLTSDVGSFATVGPGSPLVGLPSGLPPVGFADASPTWGLFFLFGLAATPSPDSIFVLEFTALGAGTSEILPFGTPVGSPLLAVGGAPVPASITGGIVTVTSTVPEPAPLALLSAGLLILAARRSRGT